MSSPPDYLNFDLENRRLRLDPHELRFYQNPYQAYAWLHETSQTFFWEEFGFWCFAGFDDVSKLLRDRRFGRENPDGPPAPQPVRARRAFISGTLTLWRSIRCLSASRRCTRGSDAGQPRLRLAAGRAAAAPAGNAVAPADRRVRRQGRMRSHSRLRHAPARHHHRQHAGH